MMKAVAWFKNYPPYIYISNGSSIKSKIGFCDSNCKGTWLHNKNPQKQRQTKRR